MILEKCKNNKEVINCLKKIMENNKNKDIEKLKRIILYYIYIKKLTNRVKKKF